MGSTHICVNDGGHFRISGQRFLTGAKMNSRERILHRKMPPCISCVGREGEGQEGEGREGGTKEGGECYNYRTHSECLNCTSSFSISKL